MKNDIIEFEENLYNYLDKYLPDKLNDIKKDLSDNKIIEKLNKIIIDMQDVAYEYRQFNKDLNELLYEDYEDNEDDEQGEN